jgi:hypothetical protein
MSDYNYYEILDVAPTASDSEIKAAYYRVVRTAHPDAGGTSGMFRLVSEAYETLRDPVARSTYDIQLRSPSPPPATPTPSATASAESASTDPVLEPQWGTEVDWLAPIGSPTSQRQKFGRAWWISLLTSLAAAVGLYALFAYILFVRPDFLIPAAAGDDLAQWFFINSPLPALFAIMYTLWVLGSFFGQFPGMARIAHRVTALAIVVWPFTYWSIATGAERWSFVGIALLWVVYIITLVVTPMIIGGKYGERATSIL